MNVNAGKVPSTPGEGILVHKTVRNATIFGKRFKT